MVLIVLGCFFLSRHTYLFLLYNIIPSTYKWIHRMKPSTIYFSWLTIASTLYALPLNPLSMSYPQMGNSRTSSVKIPKVETLEHTTLDNDEADAPFDIQVDRFAQLVSTHWQYEHLESIATTTFKEIADQMNNHIHITVTNAQSPQDLIQQPFDTDESMDVMDLGLLKAQILGAIQAHTESNLPMAWDQLGDKLSQSALEAYVKHLFLSLCLPTGSDLNDGIISSQCLVNGKATQITSQIDRYIATHLTNMLDIMNRSVLPDLFRHTTKDLEQVLDYFNDPVLRTNDLHLSLEIIPWQDRQDANRARLLEAARLNTNHDHQGDSILSYAILAKI